MSEANVEKIEEVSRELKPAGRDGPDQDGELQIKYRHCRFKNKQTNNDKSVLAELVNEESAMMEGQVDR